MYPHELKKSLKTVVKMWFGAINIPELAQLETFLPQFESCVLLWWPGIIRVKIYTSYGGDAQTRAPKQMMALQSPKCREL